MLRDVISKESFVGYLRDVEQLHEFNSEKNKLYRKYNVDGYVFPPDCSDTVLSLLHEVAGKADEAEWISFYVFELNFGSKWTPGSARWMDGRDIPLRTAGDLYDLLCAVEDLEEEEQ